MDSGGLSFVFVDLHCVPSEKSYFYDSFCLDLGWLGLYFPPPFYFLSSSSLL